MLKGLEESCFQKVNFDNLKWVKSLRDWFKPGQMEDFLRDILPALFKYLQGFP